MTFEIVIFVLIVSSGYFVQGLTGFGATIFSMPLLLMLYKLDIVVPVCISLSIIQSIFVIIKDYKDIHIKEIAKVLILATIGIPIGLYIGTVVSEVILKKVLGIYLLLNSIYNLINIYRKRENNLSKSKLLVIFPILGGCFQGVFGTGGPLVVIYASNKIKDKTNFRASLFPVWLTTNIIIIIQKISAGYVNIDVIKLVLIAIPFILFTTFLGKKTLAKVSKRFFSTLINLILIFSAITLLI